MPSAPPLLRLDHVTKHYESPGGTERLTILDDISFEVAEGSSTAIVGPSGSGKSTLLNVIGTLDQPTDGHVLFDGKDLSELDERQLAAIRNRALGFVFQSHYLLPQCTVLENALVPTLAQANRADPKPSAEPPEARARRLLERVGLAGRTAHRPGELSGGERQRVAVVRALINGPRLLLADEPTGALDHASAQSLGQLLIDLNREEKVTLIVVTHARDLAARMTRALALKDGHLLPAQEG